MRIPGFADQAPVDVARESVKDFFADDMLTYASALSYHLVLALFPFVIFLLALFGAVGLTSVFDDQLQQARAAIPPEAFQLVSQVIDQIRSQARPGILSGSILVSLWAASAAMRSITIALNVAYDVTETRPAWQRYLLSLLATIGLALLLLVAGVFQIIGPQAAEWLATHLGLASFVPTLWVWLRWPAVVLLLLLVVSVIYKVAPNVDQPFRYVTPGSVTATVVWIVASLGFSAYVDRFGNYGATYGSLAAMVVLLIYLFVSAAVLLFGAEINATIHPAVASKASRGVEKARSRGDGKQRTEADEARRIAS